LNRAPEGSPEAQRGREALLAAAQKLGGSMDRLIWSVQPENDTLENLVTFLADYAPTVLRPNGIACELDLSLRLPPLPLHGDMRQHLFLAVNEALHNVVKHSRATQAWLRVAWAAPWLEIGVEDDGCGLASASPRPGGGNGLKNLWARVAALHGTVGLSLRPSGGTRLAVRVRPGGAAVAVRELAG
jgi:signal transduction histidine kinase